jgi:hypothetical protein
VISGGNILSDVEEEIHAGNRADETTGMEMYG